MPDVLNALDATFLEVEQESDGALMSIGGVMVFDPLPGGGVPTVDQVRSELAARLTELPRYSERLSTPRTGGFSWPSWVPDKRFDIRSHISHVALPAPGGRGELCAWAADYYSHRLDRSRPLWEMALIQGLQDGGWALAHKTHHCLVDGVGSVALAYLLLDGEPDPAPRARPRRAPQSEDTRQDAGAARAPQAVVQAARAGARAAAGGLHAITHPREAVARSASLLELLVKDELIAAPTTSLNVPIGSSRRFAVVNVPLGELKLVRRALGGSVNDVALAACTTGLRRLLLERGESPPTQRAMVPMNLRGASEHLALGNRISSLFVELPVAEPVAHARYRQIVATTERVKHSNAAVGASTMLDLTALAPPVLHSMLARSLYATRLFNVTVTNVPGPQLPLYALGSRLREVHPVVPLAAAHTVGIAVFSYDGVVSFGVIADRETTPDIAVLAGGIDEGVRELLALVPGAGDGYKCEQARISWQHA